MSRDERAQILKVLSGAIVRETNAFNFYYQGSENPQLPAGARGLLVRLAEEERIHRQLLVDEYRAIEKQSGGEAGGERGGELAYRIPAEPNLLPLEIGAGFEAAAVVLPTRLVGGDNIVSRALRGHKGAARGALLLLYDAMGHGLQTTEINALASQAVGEYIDAVSLSLMDDELLGPKRLVELINARVAERYAGEGVFLTVLGVLFDARLPRLVFTCAGHEPPFIVSGDAAARSLMQTQLIAGIEPSYRYREHGVEFGPGDLLCVFSDGIIEAENDAGRLFGRSGVARVLERHRGADPPTIVRELLAALAAHLGELPLRDEVSLAVVSRKGD